MLAMTAEPLQAGYTLVNFDRRERLGFGAARAASVRDLAGNPVTAALVTYYLFQHMGQTISFLPPAPEPPFTQEQWDQIQHYPDVTPQVMDTLVELGVLAS